MDDDEHRIEFEMPPMYEKQRQALFDPRRYVCIEASTKAGKTSAAAIWLTYKALKEGEAGKNYWWVAPVSTQADIAFSRVLTAIKPEQRTANLTHRTITLINGAVLWFKSADHPDTLYGDDVWACVIDEASRVKEPSWHAVRSTLTYTRGQIRFIGNVKGRKNWFYMLSRKAQQEMHLPDSEMAYYKLIAHDAIEAGVLALAEVEDARRTLPDHVFRELYLAEPSDDEGNPFGLDQIRKCTGPLSTERPHVWGWDLAKTQDYTVGIALDRRGRVCRFERFRHDWSLTMPRILKETGMTAALIDSTGVGDPIVEMLQKSGGLNFEGYGFTGPSKQKLMEGLAVAIQTTAIRFPPGPIVDELEMFEYEHLPSGATRYRAPEGFHDDCVMALALAVMHLARAMTYDSTMSWVGGPGIDEDKHDNVSPAPVVHVGMPAIIATHMRLRRWEPGRGWNT